MKGWDEGAMAPGPHDSVLPRSIGVLIAALAALLFWACLIWIVQAIN